MTTIALWIIALACLPAAITVGGLLLMWTGVAIVWLARAWRGLLFTAFGPAVIGLVVVSTLNSSSNRDYALRTFALALIACVPCIPFVAKLHRNEAEARRREQA